MMRTRVSQSSVYRWVAVLSFGRMFLKLSDQCIVDLSKKPADQAAFKSISLG